MVNPISIDRRRAVGLITASIAAPFVIRPAGAQSALPDQKIPDILKGSGELRIAGYGGIGQEAQRRAYFEPFEKATSIKVRDFTDADGAKVKAMVDTGNVEWDLVGAGRGTIMSLMKTGDYFEKIDYSLIDDGVGNEYRFEYGLEMTVWCIVLGYRTDAFKGAAPANWADFWDIRKFPGPRAMWGIGPGAPEMEIALLAAGVPSDKLYPLDVDKALASYEKIKNSVAKWYATGAAPGQMLTDREVVMTTAFSGRTVPLQQQGLPIGVCWNQAIAKRDAWAIPKGAKNKANAMKFIAYSTMAIPQARFSMAAPYGPVNTNANEYIPPAQLRLLPSAPEIKKQLVSYNYDWWVENQAAANAKFANWLLG
ncbi:ABC transporter substrate-binding protein [Bradyrhizobium sp. UFLA06-06]